MIYRDITYTDYNGEERTDRFYFNLSRADLIRMQFSDKDGFEKKIQRIIDSHDNEQIWNTFEDIVYRAVGEKSADGRRFDKSVEAKKNFVDSEAYSEFIYMLMTGNYGKDPEYAAKFVSSLVDQESIDKVMAKMNVPEVVS